MSAIIGFVLFIIGWALLVFGIMAPGFAGAALWQVLLGIPLMAGGYVMSEYSGSGCLVGLIAALMAGLGIILLIASIASLLIGVGLYTTAGAIVRILLSILLIALGYLALQMRGSLATSGSDDVF